MKSLKKSENLNHKATLKEDVFMKNYKRFIDEEIAYKELKESLEKALGRQLTELEDRKMNWLARDEYETIGVFVDIFKELSDK